MNKPTLLIVDDEPANLKTLAGMLKNEYRIVFAKSGEEALSLIEKRTTPNCILLDIMMPGMDGYEVCTRLKKDTASRKIPVIFISAKTESHEKKKGLSLGATAYITKPFDAEEILSVLKQFLKK